MIDAALREESFRRRKELNEKLRHEEKINQEKEKKKAYKAKLRHEGMIDKKHAQNREAAASVRYREVYQKRNQKIEDNMKRKRQISEEEEQNVHARTQKFL